MLKQETISLIALASSVLGVIMLVFFAESFEAREVKVEEIDESLAGWPVKVNAKVESAYLKENTAFLQLYDGTGKIKAVIFRPSPEQQSLASKNSFACFKGKVQVYRNELEIIVEGVEPWH
jgi:aspartyl/asparaginyl-tRNA synthetase